MIHCPEPDERVASPDGTPIAVFRSGAGPPIVLVHGAAADHTTWRVLNPLLATRFAVAAIDRRGRGASGDLGPYSIEREFEDVAAVADALAMGAGEPVAVIGHSFGGRVALGGALVSRSIAAVVSYEGAPPAVERPYQRPALLAQLAALHDEGRLETLLVTFLGEVVGMTPADLDAYRANPVWPARVAAAGTIVRELAAEISPAADLAALARVEVPVLQVLGSESLPSFAAAVTALDDRLPRGRVAVIGGARHAAHHTHPDELVAQIVEHLARR